MKKLENTHKVEGAWNLLPGLETNFYFCIIYF